MQVPGWGHFKDDVIDAGVRVLSDLCDLELGVQDAKRQLNTEVFFRASVMVQRLSGGGTHVKLFHDFIEQSRQLELHC